MARIARPLNDMLKKGAKPNFGNNSTDQLESFAKLKMSLVSPPVLALPKAGLPYVIDTDASSYQLGCALLQMHGDEPRAVGYWSRSLIPAEQNYSAAERECLSVVWAIRALRPYVEGTSFTVRTDHNSLNWLMSHQDPSGRLARWRLLLSEFEYVIDYRLARVHQVPDALSRIPTTGLDQMEYEDDLPCLVSRPRRLGDVTRVYEELYPELEPWDAWYACGIDPFQTRPVMTTARQNEHCAHPIGLDELISELAHSSGKSPLIP